MQAYALILQDAAAGCERLRSALSFAANSACGESLEDATCGTLTDTWLPDTPCELHLPAHGRLDLLITAARQWNGDCGRPTAQKDGPPTLSQGPRSLTGTIPYHGSPALRIAHRLVLPGPLEALPPPSAVGPPLAIRAASIDSSGPTLSPTACSPPHHRTQVHRLEGEPTALSRTNNDQAPPSTAAADTAAATPTGALVTGEANCTDALSQPQPQPLTSSQSALAASVDLIKAAGGATAATAPPPANIHEAASAILNACSVTNMLTVLQRSETFASQEGTSASGTATAAACWDVLYQNQASLDYAGEWASQRGDCPTPMPTPAPTPAVLPGPTMHAVVWGQESGGDAPSAASVGDGVGAAGLPPGHAGSTPSSVATGIAKMGEGRPSHPGECTAVPYLTQLLFLEPPELLEDILQQVRHGESPTAHQGIE
jgi:hypothetical protein